MEPTLCVVCSWVIRVYTILVWNTISGSSNLDICFYYCLILTLIFHLKVLINFFFFFFFFIIIIVVVVVWCEPRDYVVTQPTIKIEIWSQKAEIGLIGVWHNGNLPQGTSTIGMSRMMPRSQLIFDKSDSVRSRTEEFKNHSYTLKLKNS